MIAPEDINQLDVVSNNRSTDRDGNLQITVTFKPTYRQRPPRIFRNREAQVYSKLITKTDDFDRY